MRRVDTSGDSLPILSWADTVDAGAAEQAEHLARLPFAVDRIALMPDVHQGYGMPIGGVLATCGAVVPNAVGLDIGCGMHLCRLNVGAEELDHANLVAAVDAIRAVVPVGFAHHRQPQPLKWAPDGPITEREFDRARMQVGTLGGGNHFIEIQAGDDGFVYVMIHSGSRNVGKQVADYYNNLARTMNARWHSSVPDAWALAFLPLDSSEGVAYIKEMNACVEFARLNREAIMRLVMEALIDGWKPYLAANALDVAHNYAVMEHHGKKNVLVHRKGATRAASGEFGIIPGSQGSRSFVVVGKGNPLSFESCSHGAGRTMGRKEAVRTLSLAEEQRKLDEQGIVHGLRGVADLEEATGAYKDIDAVMAAQADLVDIVRTLRPLAVVKG